MREKVFTQVTIDDDHIIRDNKPDVVRVVCCRSDAMVEEVRSGMGFVRVSGRVCFRLLYQSDGEGEFESVVGETPFQEKILMEEATESAQMMAEVEVEDFSISIMNSRKLMIRGVLNVQVRPPEEVSALPALPYPEEYAYEQKTREVRLLREIHRQQELVRIQRELPLPSARANIGRILYYQVEFRNREEQMREGNWVRQMDAQVMVLYSGENREGNVCFETTVPIEIGLSCPDAHAEDCFRARVRPKEILLEPREDYDGEWRQFGLEMTMEVDLAYYPEEKIEALEDVYSLEKELKVERKPICIRRILMKNTSQTRLLEPVYLEEGKEDILQICGCRGRASIDRILREEESVRVEGMLNVEVLYATTEDHLLYVCNRSQHEFEQSIEVRDLSENCELLTQAEVDQLQVNLMDHDRYEVKAVIRVEVLAIEERNMDGIFSVEELPQDEEALAKQPGMIACLRRQEECLWDIAKKYRTREDEIIELGEKVLVVKQAL